MPALSEYANVEATAAAHLTDRGYRLWVDHHAEMYGAERDGWDFMAESMVALLGLVSIFETVGPSEYREYWWRHPGAIRLSDISQTRPSYTSVVRKPEGGP